MFKRSSSGIWAVAAMLALGLGLRFWNIDFGLPYTIAPDEPWHLTIALRIFRTGDLNPHWLNYPSLMFYLNALAYVPYFLVGKVMGLLSTPADIPFPESITVGVGRSLMPSQFILGRGLTALFGAGSIALIYSIGRALNPKPWVAALAALLFAVSPADVVNSHLIRPDTFAVFFALLSVFFALRILDQPSIQNYAFAGIAAGLAVSSKYNVPMIIFALLAAHFLRWGADGFRRKELYVGVGSCALAFLLTTPFAVLDFQQFLRDSGFEISKQVVGGAAGFEGNSFGWYVSFLWSNGWWWMAAALLGVVRVVWTRSRQGLVLLAFPLPYFAFISLLQVRNDRTILPVLVFIYLFAAWFIVDVVDWLVGLRRFASLLTATGAVAVSLLFVVPLLQQSVNDDLAIAQMPSREVARVWIDQHVPSGSRIAVEAYSPYVDTRRFTVEGLNGMIDHPSDWYVQNGFEYLVFSYGAYGRFYENPMLYPEYVQQYDAFFNRFTRVARFDENGYAIQVFKTGVTDLPSHRVAANFGVYGPMLEFVGYDQTGGANVTLYWRAIESRREPVQLTARLLDRSDQQIAETRGALFPATDVDGRWPTGIVRMPVKLAAPNNSAGLYRIELDVDAEGIGRIPVLSRENTPISDKLFIGPIKLAPAPPSADELQRASTSDAQFGNIFALEAYQVDAIVRAGDSLNVSLYWKSIAKTNKDYTIFVHLLDSSGKIRAQIDSPPRGGAYPTSIWDAGEVIRDDYALQLPRDLAPGEYHIEIGAYEYPSLIRLSINSADGKPLGDHLILDRMVTMQ